MNKIYKRIEINNKTYIIKKISGCEVLRILGLIGFVSSRPVGSLICTLLCGTIEQKVNAKKMLELLSSNKELLKENIFDFFETWKDNFDIIKDVFNTILLNTEVEIKKEDETTEKQEINFEEDFDFDDIDEWVDIITEAFKLNLETGLKKSVKKLPFLGVELKRTQEKKEQ